MIKVQEVNFDIDSIEHQIKKMRYNGNGLIKDISVENAKLPSIAEVFYEKIFLREIPSPEKLYREYLSKHFSKEDNGRYRLNNTNKAYDEKGIKARVYRAYPSLLRDFHFYILCYSSGLFESVEYSFLVDTREGIDLFVTYKGNRFAISLFVNTRRSLEYKKKKYKRHDYSNLKEICISINPFDRKSYVGDYALYGESHLQEMIREMENELVSSKCE